VVAPSGRALVDTICRAINTLFIVVNRCSSVGPITISYHTRVINTIRNHFVTSMLFRNVFVEIEKLQQQRFLRITRLSGIHMGIAWLGVRDNVHSVFINRFSSRRNCSTTRPVHFRLVQSSNRKSKYSISKLYLFIYFFDILQSLSKRSLFHFYQFSRILKTFYAGRILFFF